MSFLWKSSIGRKLVMSISGGFFVLFLVFHMSMNAVVIISPEAYNMICEFLGANWYTLAGTAVLAAGFLVHLIYALVLTLQNRKARGNQRYAVSDQKNVPWSSRNMFALGVIIVLGLLLHLFNFWAKMQLVEILGQHQNSLGLSPTNGAGLIIYTFSNPIYCAVYLIWFFAIWFHLTHGFWSAFQTLGWNSKVWFCRMKVISNIVATLLMLGFASVVVFYLGYAMSNGMIWWGL